MATKSNYCFFLLLSMNLSYKDFFFLKWASGNLIFMNFNKKHTNFMNTFIMYTGAQYFLYGLFSSSEARILRFLKWITSASSHPLLTHHSTGKGCVPRSALGVGPCDEDGQAQPLPLRSLSLLWKLHLLDGCHCGVRDVLRFALVPRANEAASQLHTRNAVYNLTTEINVLLQQSIVRGIWEVLRRKRKKPVLDTKCLCPFLPCFAAVI